MVSWWWLLVAISGGSFGGFVLSALIGAGRVADLEEDVGYWRRQCTRMCERFGVNLPLGPTKGE
jgi:hypothetical protein